MKYISIIIIFKKLLFCLNGDALEFYLNGEYENLNKNSKSALVEFKKALSLEPNSQIIQKEVANCYMQNNDTLNAKLHYLNALEISKYNLNIGFEILDFLNKIDNDDSYQEILNKLMNKNPSNLKLRYIKVEYLFSKKNYEGIIDEYKNIYFIENNKIEFLEKLIKISILLEKENYLDKVLHEISYQDSASSEPLLAISRLKLIKGEHVNSIEYLVKAYKLSKNENTLLKLIRIAIDYDLENYIDKYIDMFNQYHDTSKEIQLLMIENAVKKMDYYYALKLMKNIINKGLIEYNLLEKFIAVADELNNLDFAMSIIENQFYKNNNKLLSYMMGDIYFIEGHSDDALRWYLKTLYLDSQNIELKHIVSTLSESLFEYELSDSIFTDIIKQDSTNSTALNNYAYSLSERPKSNLIFALDLAKKAIKLNPNNAAFLDTIGWIYFKLNKYEEALNYITKSLENDENNEVILEHLLQVYLKLNYISAAKNTYKKILELNPQNNSFESVMKDLIYE